MTVSIELGNLKITVSETKEFELTHDEAKALYSELGRFFGPKPVTVPPAPVPVYTPMFTQPPGTPPWIVTSTTKVG